MLFISIDSDPLLLKYFLSYFYSLEKKCSLNVGYHTRTRTEVVQPLDKNKGDRDDVTKTAAL